MKSELIAASKSGLKTVTFDATTHQLVPLKMDAAMKAALVEAARKHMMATGGNNPDAMYEAAITAAPTPAAQSAGQEAIYQAQWHEGDSWGDVQADLFKKYAVKAFKTRIVYPAPVNGGERECTCDFRTKLVGDGCDVCNPELASDLVECATDAQQVGVNIAKKRDDDPTHETLRQIATDVRNAAGGPSDSPQPFDYVLGGWRAARAALTPPAKVGGHAHEIRTLVPLLRGMIVGAAYDDVSESYVRRAADLLEEYAALTSPAKESPYPTGDVAGACACGSWPGGECLKCPESPAKVGGDEREAFEEAARSLIDPIQHEETFERVGDGYHQFATLFAWNVWQKARAVGGWRQ